MMRGLRGVVVSGLCVLLFAGADWRQFRGPSNNWVSGERGLPTSFADGDNVAWKAELPGRGLSVPVIIGDRVVVTCASGIRQDRLRILCFDAASGRLQFDRQFWATGRTGCHPKTCVAAPSPVSDGKHVFAFYSSGDVVGLDLAGNLLWLRGLMVDYPNASNSIGMASSPVLAGGTLVVQLDNDSRQSLAVGIDAATGENRWIIERPSLSSWTSPLVLPDGRAVVLQSGKRLSAHDAATGRELWAYENGCSTIASSTVVEDRLFVPSFGTTTLRFHSGSQGPEQLWRVEQLRPSTASLVVYEERLYVVRGSILNCADAKTGKVLWKLRLKGPISATPVAADGHLYLFNEDGLGQVVDTRTPKGQLAGTGDLGETILSTPAIANGAMYIRSDQHLWKIAKR